MQIVYSLLLLTVAQHAFCWGNLGHGTVAYVAKKYLTQNAASYLGQVLVDDQGEQIDYFDAAIWPDEIKRQRPYTEEWHFLGSTLPYSNNIYSSTISLILFQMPKTIHHRPAK